MCTGIESLLVSSSVKRSRLNRRYCFFKLWTLGFGKNVRMSFSALMHSTSKENSSTASDPIFTRLQVKFSNHVRAKVGTSGSEDHSDCFHSTLCQHRWVQSARMIHYELMPFSTLGFWRKSTVDFTCSYIEVWCLPWQFLHPRDLHCDASCPTTVQLLHIRFRCSMALLAASSSTLVQLWPKCSFDWQCTQVGLRLGFDPSEFPRSIFSSSLLHACGLKRTSFFPWSSPILNGSSPHTSEGSPRAPPGPIPSICHSFAQVYPGLVQVCRSTYKPCFGLWLTFSSSRVCALSRTAYCKIHLCFEACEC